MRRCSQRAFFYLLLVSGCVIRFNQAQAQSAPQPTRVPGTNQIVRSSDGRTYTFLFQNIPLYRYTTVQQDRPAGNFVGLEASASGNDYFTPAMCGGVLAVDGQRIVYPCEPGVSFRLMNQYFSSDSVALHWTMYLDRRPLYEYRMSFQMRGRTLIIDVNAAGGSRNGAGISLGEAYSRQDDFAVVPVPYLTLLNLLHRKSTKSFTSLFFDWERTNCSRLLPLTKQSNHAIFASSVEYFPQTNGTRNILHERIYLTVSVDLDEVMPNVVGPEAPLRRALQSRIILSYHPPYPWILGPLIPGSTLPSYLDSLNNLGVTDVALLVKDWWWSGFDRGNPLVLPANDFLMQRDGWDCFPYERQGGGGDAVLRRVRDKARRFGYLFGLHQNYVDMYQDARPGALPIIRVDSSLMARLPDGGQDRAWAFAGNCRGENAWAVKPSRVLDVTRQVSSAIYNAYRADWNYLDVTSSLLPSGPLPIEGRGVVNSVVDFDASEENPGRDSAGTFLYTLKKYRAVPATVRAQTGNGPVEGEGGHHFLYAGYFDDFEARIQTAIPEIRGYTAPLLLDFQLRKLRSKSAFHGAGHIYVFYDRGWGAFFRDREVLTYVATEIAYGNGGLVTKSAHTCLDDWRCDHSLRQFALENQHVLPLQILLLDAQPTDIAYVDAVGAERTSSRYIGQYPDNFADIRSPQFMGRVKISYSNGVVVYVNRNREAGDWSIAGLPSGGTYHYNVLVGGRMKQAVGARPSEPVVLPAECGWVWYTPN